MDHGLPQSGKNFRENFFQVRGKSEDLVNYGCVDGWIDEGWMDDGWMDGWMDG